MRNTRATRIDRLEELLALAVSLLADERGLSLEELRSEVFSPPPPPQDLSLVEDGGLQVIRLARLKQKLAVGQSSIYRWIETEGFPKPIKFGRAAAWIENEVDAWVQKRMAVRDAGSKGARRPGSRGA